MSTQLKPIGDWVDQLLIDIFFQPDDNFAIKTYEENVDTSFINRINHDSFTFEQYKEAVKQARGAHNISLESNSEVLKWDDPEKRGGVVAHLSKFTLKNKTTGQETKATSLILSSVKWADGKRVLTEMTEVSL